MKIFSKLSVLLLAILPLASCVQEIEPAQEQESLDSIQFEVIAEKTGTFGSSTKAVKTEWADGDQIMLFFNNHFENGDEFIIQYDNGIWHTVKKPADHKFILGNGIFTAVCQDGAISVNDKAFNYAGGPLFEGSGKYKYYESAGGAYVSIHIPLHIFGTQFQFTVENLKAKDGWILKTNPEGKNKGIIKGIKKLNIGNKGLVAEYSDTVTCIENSDGIAFFPVVDTAIVDDAVYRLNLTDKNGSSYTRTFDNSASGKKFTPKSAIIVSGDLNKDWKTWDKYVCFTVTEGSGNISLVKKGKVDGYKGMEYSLDGYKWDACEDDSTAVDGLSAGNTVYFKAKDENPNTRLGDGTYYVHFTCSDGMKVNVSGNIMRLLHKYDPSNVAKDTVLSGSNQLFTFYSLFKNMPIVDASELELPAKNLASDCYSAMFS